MALKHKHAMVVEDSRDTRLLIRKILETAGVEVVEQETVDGAIEEATRHPPHIILLDLRMSGRNGFDFLEFRRQNAILKEIPVIVVSGLSDHDSVFRAISLGADDYLIKPVRAQTLLMRIRRALKDQDLLIHDFGAQAGKARIVFSGNLLQAADSSLLVSSPIRFSPKTQVELQSPLLERGDLGPVVWSTSSGASIQAGTATYWTRIEGSGLKGSLKKKLQSAGR